IHHSTRIAARTVASGTRLSDTIRMRAAPLLSWLCFAVLACSDRSSTAPPAPTPPAPVATTPVDAPADAADRFVVGERVESHGTVLDVKPSDADCPSLSLDAGRKLLRIQRCPK